jgi:F-type H+-transporting ATPase subunit b
MADSDHTGVDPHETHTEVGAPEQHESSGMPQLNANDWAPQLVWLAISFGLLYVLMARVALPRIATVLEERRDKIADDIDKADQLKKQTDEAIQSYEAALADARARAHTIVAENRRTLEQENEGLRADIDAQLQQQATEAETKIASMKEAAMANVRSVAIDAVDDIVQMLIGDSVDEPSIGRAVDAELNR